MTVYITPPLPTPTGITTTLLPSTYGPLVADTTYYYRICVQNYGSEASRFPSTYKSGWSVEGSFTTTATHRAVRFDWVAVSVPSGKGNPAYSIAYTTVSGDYVVAGRRIGNSGSCTVTNPPIVDGKTGYSYNYGTSYDFCRNFWLGTTTPKPGGLSREQGSILVDVSGNETLESIYAAIVAAGLGAYVWFDGSTFILDGSFDFQYHSGIVGTLYLYGYNIWLLSGYSNYSSSYLTVHFGEATTTTGKWQRGTSLRLLGSQVSTSDFCYLAQNTILRGCTVYGNFLDSTVSGLRGECRLRVIKNKFPILQEVRFEDGVVLEPTYDGCYLYGLSQSYFLVGTKEQVVYADVTCTLGPGSTPYRCFCSSYGSSNTGGITFYRSRCFRTTASEIYANGYTYTGAVQRYFDLYDCTFEGRSDNVPYVRWSVTGTPAFKQRVRMYSTFLVSVVDNLPPPGGEGSPLAGATIEIKAADGTVVGNHTTTEEGLLLDENLTLTGATTNTLTDATKTWVVNAHRGREIFILTGAGVNQVGVVLSNTATTLTLHEDLFTTPAVGDKAGFRVAVQFVELQHKEGSGSGEGPAYTTRLDYNPFTITVSKPGYRTNVTKGVLSSKSSWVVALEPNLGHSSVM